VSARYVVGDVRDVLATIPDGSIDLVLTSPPFLALRSYLPADHPDKHREIGAEPDPATFLDTLLALTAEWRRVLAPHGSICVELGDTYSGSGGAGGDYTDTGLRAGQEKFDGSARRNVEGYPLPKSLCMIPELYRVALAYGRNPLTGEPSPAGRWRCRNVVRWHRPNPPVGALGDKFRPSTSDMVVACVSGKRYFDLNAVRNAGSPNTHARTAKGVASRPTTGKAADDERRGGNFSTLATLHDTAGAPPLDTWVIPTAPYSGTVSTSRRVPCGPHDGGERTTSPDCPVHAGRLVLPPTEPRGGRGGTSSTRTPHTGGDPAQELLLGSESTDAIPDRSGSSPIPTTETTDHERAPAAKRRSKASSRTALAPATTSPDTPSEETTDRTGDTSVPPSSGEHHPGTSESRTSEDGSAGSPSTGTTDRIDDTDTQQGTSEACTCSFFRVEVESTSHYATFPPALCERPIKSMVPLKVCRTCGEPSRRIVESERNETRRRDVPSNDLVPGRVGFAASGESTYTTIGWTDCGHGDDWRSGVVLDPFAGSGTTLMVATGHGRDAIGCDIDERNAELALERVGPLLLTVEHLADGDDRAAS
jgi:hypothetical protein